MIDWIKSTAIGIFLMVVVIAVYLVSAVITPVLIMGGLILVVWLIIKMEKLEDEEIQEDDLGEHPPWPPDHGPR